MRKLCWQLWVLSSLSALLLLGTGANARGLAAESPQTTVPGGAPVISLSAPNAHWIYILDLSPTLVLGDVLVVDGDTGKMLGMITSGYLPNFVQTPDAHAIYMSETYYSRGARGKRTDVITAYDPHTLTPLSEARLPNGRLLSPGKKYGLSLSTDGRYLFSANMRPAFSVSVIDLKRFRFFREISTPGCALAYPTGDASFAAICGNGALMNVSISPTGAVSKSLTSPFFNPSDPVFDAPAIVQGSQTVYFVSYDGRVYPVKREGGRATPEKPWNILSRSDRRASWRPGGYYQLLALSPTLHRLYVLMHQGGIASHKQSGTQVWVIDTSTGRVVARDLLAQPADAISVTLDGKPLLFTLKDGVLEVYRIESDRLEHLREVTRLGEEASYMSVPGEG